MDGEARRASRGSAAKMYAPPSHVARKPMASAGPRPPVGSTAEAVATARRAEHGSGGRLLPVLTSPSPPPVGLSTASKRSGWATPRAPSDADGDDFHASSSESFAAPPRRAEQAAARQRGASEGLFASETEHAQLAYMEQMYGTIHLLNAELASERRSRAERQAAARPASESPNFEVATYHDTSMQSLDVGELDEPPMNLIVSPSPVAPSQSQSPRKLRAMTPTSRAHAPSPPSRSARPPSSPRSPSATRDWAPEAEQELCATLGQNAELRMRSRDMERSAEKAALELALVRKQLQMAERRAANRDDKLRALLKDKMSWQKELQAVRAQVVEEKMRQVDLFRDVEAAKREFAGELAALDTELHATQDENAELRAQAGEMKAQADFQSRRMDDMARQAKAEKERFVALLEDTRQRFHEWKDGEAAAMQEAHDEVVATLKTEFELKLRRHQQEKDKLRDKVKDLEVSLRLVQKDRTLSPLELTLRKASILGGSDGGATAEAELIEAHARVHELEALLAHSKEYQARQDHIMQVSEATISRLMQEREVTALENLSLHPFAAGLRELEAASVACEPQTAKPPLSRAPSPKHEELEEILAVSMPVGDATMDATSDGEGIGRSQTPSTMTPKERALMEELARVNKELEEAQAKAKAVTMGPEHSREQEKEEFSAVKQVQCEEEVCSEVKDVVGIPRTSLEASAEAEAGGSTHGDDKKAADSRVPAAEAKDSASPMEEEQEIKQENPTDAGEECPSDVPATALLVNVDGAEPSEVASTTDADQVDSSYVVEPKVAQPNDKMAVGDTKVEGETMLSEARESKSVDDSKDMAEKTISQNVEVKSSEQLSEDFKETLLEIVEHPGKPQEHSEEKVGAPLQGDIEKRPEEGSASHTKQEQGAAPDSSVEINHGGDGVNDIAGDDSAEKQLDEESTCAEMKADIANFDRDIGGNERDEPAAMSNAAVDGILSPRAKDKQIEAARGNDNQNESKHDDQDALKQNENTGVSLGGPFSPHVETAPSLDSKDPETSAFVASALGATRVEDAMGTDKSENAVSADRLCGKINGAVELPCDCEEKETTAVAPYEREDKSAEIETPCASESKQFPVAAPCDKVCSDEKLMEMVESFKSEEKPEFLESEGKLSTGLEALPNHDENPGLLNTYCESTEKESVVADASCEIDEKVSSAMDAPCESKQSSTMVLSEDASKPDNDEKAVELVMLYNSEEKTVMFEVPFDSESKESATAAALEAEEKSNTGEKAVELVAACTTEEKSVTMEKSCESEEKTFVMDEGDYKVEEEESVVNTGTPYDSEEKREIALPTTNVGVTSDSEKATDYMATADLANEDLSAEANPGVVATDVDPGLKGEGENTGEVIRSSIVVVEDSDSKPSVSKDPVLVSNEEEERATQASEAVKDAPGETNAAVESPSQADGVQCENTVVSSETSNTKDDSPEEPVIVIPEPAENVSNDLDVSLSEQSQLTETADNEATRDTEIVSSSVTATAIIDEPIIKETEVASASFLPSDEQMVAETCIAAAAEIAISAVHARSLACEDSSSEYPPGHVTEASDADEISVELQGSSENDGRPKVCADAGNAIKTETDIFVVTLDDTLVGTTPPPTSENDDPVSEDRPVVIQAESTAVERSDTVQEVPLPERAEGFTLSETSLVAESRADSPIDSPNELVNPEDQTLDQMVAIVPSEDHDLKTQPADDTSPDTSFLATAESFIVAIQNAAISLVAASRRQDSVSAALIHEEATLVLVAPGNAPQYDHEDIVNIEPSMEIMEVAEPAENSIPADSVLTLSPELPERVVPSAEPASNDSIAHPEEVDGDTKNTEDPIGAPEAPTKSSYLPDVSMQNDAQSTIATEDNVSNAPSDLPTNVSSATSNEREVPEQVSAEDMHHPETDTLLEQNNDVVDADVKMVAGSFVEDLIRLFTPALSEDATQQAESSNMVKIAAATETVGSSSIPTSPEEAFPATDAGIKSDVSGDSSADLPNKSAERISPPAMPEKTSICHPASQETPPSATTLTELACEEVHTEDAPEVVSSASVGTESFASASECDIASTAQVFVESIEAAVCSAVAATQYALESPLKEATPPALEDAEAEILSSVTVCDGCSSKELDDLVNSTKVAKDEALDPVIQSSGSQTMGNDSVDSTSLAPTELDDLSLLMKDHTDGTKEKHVHFKVESKKETLRLDVERTAHDFVGTIEDEVLTAFTARQESDALLLGDKTEESHKICAVPEDNHDNRTDEKVVANVASLFATQAIAEVLNRLNHLSESLVAPTEAVGESSNLAQGHNQLFAKPFHVPVMAKSNTGKLLEMSGVEVTALVSFSADGEPASEKRNESLDMTTSCIPGAKYPATHTENPNRGISSSDTEASREVINELCAAVEANIQATVAITTNLDGDDSNIESTETSPAICSGETNLSTTEPSNPSSQQNVQNESAVGSAPVLMSGENAEVDLSASVNAAEETQLPDDTHHNEVSTVTVARMPNREQLFEPNIVEVQVRDESAVKFVLQELVKSVDVQNESVPLPMTTNVEDRKPVVETSPGDCTTSPEPKPEVLVLTLNGDVPVDLVLANDNSAVNNSSAERDATSREDVLPASPIEPLEVDPATPTCPAIDPSVYDAIQALLSVVEEDQVFSEAQHEEGDNSDPVAAFPIPQEDDKVRECERLSIPTDATSEELPPFDKPLAGVPSEQVASHPFEVRSADNSREQVELVVVELCKMVEMQQSTERHYQSFRHSFIDSGEMEDTVSSRLPGDEGSTLSVPPPVVERPARRSILFLDMPDDIAEAKEAAENAMKRQVHKRRASRRAPAEIHSAELDVLDVSRFTSDPTLRAYDARHDLGQPFAMLDSDIFSVHVGGRDVGLGGDSEVVGKRRTFLQDNHCKNLALRQIPAFNYVPVRVKFQWSDFVVAMPVSRANSGATPAVGAGVRLSKSPVEPMRMLQKRGRKLPCGSYVVVSAFIRPLEDGNENLRVQIYDAERVEEFQFDFFEDHMRRYHLESTGVEAQALEFLSHLEFRREQGSIIIKLPDKKVKDGETKPIAAPGAPENRRSSERVMVAEGEIRHKDSAESPRQRHSHYRHHRPSSSPEVTSGKLPVRFVHPRPRQDSPSQPADESESNLDDSPDREQAGHEALVEEKHEAQEATSPSN